MPILSQNPATEEIILTRPTLSSNAIIESIDTAQSSYMSCWKSLPIQERAEYLLKLSQYFRDNAEEFAKLITTEMGMPIAQSRGEVEKTAFIAEYYATEGAAMISPTTIHIQGQESWVQYDPLGVVFVVAPWNFPVYLSLRPTLPALLAGNTIILKHASNVPQTAERIQQAFHEVGFPEGVFTYLPISSRQAEEVIRHPAVQMIALTGSEKAGSAVAAIAGSEIKETVLELGGNDPFIILENAHLEKALEQAVTSRLRNCGQSCNAAKRFLVHASLFDRFVQGAKEMFETYRIGDPFDPDTELGPLASQHALVELHGLVADARQKGASCLTGGNRCERPGYYYEPTILTNVTPAMDIYHTEVFGPVVTITPFETDDEAIQLANDSRYGLGASLWTEDVHRAKNIATQLDAGTVFINSMVRSDPRLPYGGAKKSGYGREFSDVGLKEFTNIKSIVIR